MSPTLLLVEDDKSVRYDIRIYLEDNGFAIVEANNGMEALELIQAQKPDLVLTELVLARVSGLAFISALKSLSPDTPIIVVSDTNNPENIMHAIRQGAWDYVRKPIADMAMLAIIITRALERARLIQENRNYQQHLERLIIERTTANERLQQEIKERAHAEASEKEQRILAESLRDTAAALNSTLNFEEVLDQILTNVERVVHHKIANIALIEGDVARPVRWRGYEDYTNDDNMRAARLSIDEAPGLRWMIENRKPLIIPDVTAFPGWYRFEPTAWIRSYVGVPIRSGQNVIGFLGLDSPEPDYFKEIHAHGLQSFVDQAALAIENARLYKQAQELAAFQERNRIAHDLHDAVSQTLWSAALIADTLPASWEKSPVIARKNLDTLRQLTHSALAEMRAMILELTPGALAEIPLGELFQQLVQAFMGRTGIQATLLVEGDQLLPPRVQVMLYRISQEALNNVARHAKATKAEICLQYASQSAKISIRDNGHGFNLKTVPPGHLGLGIMQERAASIGAILSVSSEIHHGTTIEVTWRSAAEIL